MTTPEYKTTEADKLIYQNSNTYRIHADNLRWSLLGGYAVFLAAITGFSQSDSGIISINDPSISLLAFLLSFIYLWILAVQNWFYNLFARWVDDCENKLINGVQLVSLHQFAGENGAAINPFHPAFFFAEVLVGSVAYFFLTLTIKNISIPFLAPLLATFPTWVINLLWIFLFILYVGGLNIVFLKWDKCVYKPIITRLSNLYKP